ncbi:MAG: hypothetical protein K9H61_06830 [Bacteroidia bacterium]|nr:hypothetical protein [Bacteroidia bacterium]MCF8427832.1 hypothetical protein [Bacteroidia bacterium]MCF8446693.1 hypothetical protein [Bacteroidia bacterium]
MDLLKRIKDRAPEYDSQYYDMILDFTIEQGGKAGTSTEADRWKQGKYFSTRYEMYMYAALLGLKKDYKIPITYGTKKDKFIEMRAWQPQDITDYVIMGVITKADFNFNEFENWEEEKVEKKITELKGILEDYANGGFDLIRAKKESDPNYFLQNENCFLDLLG